MENKKRRLDSWSKELNKREALTERERLKLEEEKKKVIHSYYIMLKVIADDLFLDMTL